MDVGDIGAVNVGLDLEECMENAVIKDVKCKKV